MIFQKFSEFFSNPLFLFFLTLLSYTIGQYLYKKSKFFPFMHPVIIASAIIFSFLSYFRISSKTYLDATTMLVLLLGPVIVGLALPVYEKRKLLYKKAFIIIFSILSGSFVTAASGMFLCYVTGLHTFLQAMFVKSATTPIAISTGIKLGIPVDLIILYTITCGVMGSILGLPILKALKLHTKIGSGLALGTCSHAFGTMSAMSESKQTASFAGFAFALNGFFISVFVPFIFAYIYS